jgi:microcystin-dependent protein
MEVGSIIPFAGSVIPEEYLVCDGSAVSRADYSDLFEIVGTTYGAGDGSTTFNLPNLSGKVALGSSLNHLIGSTGGESEHYLTSTELAQHDHEVPQHGHGNNLVFSIPSLSHTVSQQPAYKYTQLNGTGGCGFGNTSNRYNSRASGGMSRSTNVSIAAHAAASCTVSGGVSDCASFSTESAGSGAAHNNMMPYLAIVYLIQAIPDTPPAPRMLIYNGCMPVTPGGYYLVGTKM